MTNEKFITNKIYLMEISDEMFSILDELYLPSSQEESLRYVKIITGFPILKIISKNNNLFFIMEDGKEFEIKLKQSLWMPVALEYGIIIPKYKNSVWNNIICAISRAKED